MSGKQYSAEEKRAYYIGVGASIGMGRVKNIKKAALGMTPAEKKSFYNGFDDGMNRRAWNTGGKVKRPNGRK